MTDRPKEELTDHDREAIREAKQEIRAAPPLPAPKGQFGCLAAIVGVVAMLVWPPLVRQLPALEFFSPFVVLGGVVAVLGGIVFSFFGGSSGRAANDAAVETAVRHLTGGDAGSGGPGHGPAAGVESESGLESGLPRETRVRAATLLISHAYISQGPTTTEAFDRDAMATRLGASLPLVLAVEEFLVSEFNEWPIFSLADADE